MKCFLCIFFIFMFCVSYFDHVFCLSVDYYKDTCPSVEQLVFEAVQEATKNDQTVPAGLLRMHFHDCFIEGCDGSVLIDSTGSNTAEKDGPPNVSLHGFYVIDNAKTKIEKACPKVVSCADILAIAARDVVKLSGGPSWPVLKGRFDGKVSMASRTRGLPSPAFNVSQLIQNFKQRNLSMKDMVTLSGGHTLGFGHCSSFNKRLFQFSKTNDIDPTMEATFAQTLRNSCPLNKNGKNAGSFLDNTQVTFDNQYFQNLVQGKGVFTSDESLFVDTRTTKIVQDYASHQDTFFAEFAKSMIKMSKVGVKTKANGEIRLNCRVVNPSS